MDKINEVEFRTGRSLSWSEREVMIKEYLQGGWTKNAIWRKYTGQPKENSQIIKWMRHLGYLKDQSPGSKRKPQANYMPKGRRVSPESVKEPRQWPQEAVEQIEALKKELKNAQLQAEAYQLLIDEAEKEFKIPIRKSPTPSNYFFEEETPWNSSGTRVLVTWHDQTSLLSARLALKRGLL